MKKLKAHAAGVSLLIISLLACGGGGGGGSNEPAPSVSYGMSGNVSSSGSGLPDVTLTLSGSSSATATTDASGNFSFVNLANGSYTITASKPDYSFNPASMARTVNGANITGVNFTGTAAPFTSADMTGTWGLINSDATDTTYGSLNIAGTGSVTGGAWTTIGVSSGTYTEGTISVNNQGSIFGSTTTSSGNTRTIADGQMSLNKDLFIFAATSTSGNAEAGVAIRASGTYSTGDLQGTWSWGSPGTYGTFAIDIFGKITSGTYTEIGVGSGTITGGELAITAQGAISGSIAGSTHGTLTIQSSRMNSDKNALFIAFTEPDGKGALVAIKRSGPFTPGTDIAGTYKFTSVNKGNNVIYGSITVNSKSTVTGGNWTEIGVGSGTYTGGIIGISTQGVIAGLANSAGNVHAIQSGQMNSSKTVAVVVGNYAVAKTGVSIWVKTP